MMEFLFLLLAVLELLVLIWFGLAAIRIGEEALRGLRQLGAEWRERNRKS